MRTRYRIDRFQQTYFVIDEFEQLFEATRPDFTPIYREITALPDIEPDTVLANLLSPPRAKKWAAAKARPKFQGGNA